MAVQKMMVVYFVSKAGAASQLLAWCEFFSFFCTQGEATVNIEHAIEEAAVTGATFGNRPGLFGRGSSDPGTLGFARGEGEGSEEDPAEETL